MNRPVWLVFSLGFLSNRIQVGFDLRSEPDPKNRIGFGSNPEDQTSFLEFLYTLSHRDRCHNLSIPSLTSPPLMSFLRLDPTSFPWNTSSALVFSLQLDPTSLRSITSPPLMSFRRKDTNGGDEAPAAGICCACTPALQPHRRECSGQVHSFDCWTFLVRVLRNFLLHSLESLTLADSGSLALDLSSSCPLQLRSAITHPSLVRIKLLDWHVYDSSVPPLARALRWLIKTQMNAYGSEKQLLNPSMFLLSTIVWSEGVRVGSTGDLWRLRVSCGGHRGTSRRGAPTRPHERLLCVLMKVRWGACHHMVVSKSTGC